MNEGQTKDEIEVTPEMIEAGVEMLSRLRRDFDAEPDERIVREIFRAMATRQ